MNQIKRIFYSRYCSNPVLIHTALAFLTVCILSCVYKPWVTDELNQDMEAEMQVLSFLSTSHTFIRILFSVLCVGITDVMELLSYWYYSYNFDNSDYSVYFFFCVLALISVQLLIEKKVMSGSSYRSQLEKLLFSFFNGNIIFAVSSYLLFFLYPVLYRIIASFDEQSFLPFIVGGLLLLLAAPTMFYMLAYFAGFYFSVSALNAAYTRLDMPAFLRCIILLALGCVLSLLINLIASKVQELVWSYIVNHFPFLPFLDE